MRSIQSLLSVSLCMPLAAFALNLKHGAIPIEAGVFSSSSGKAQDINMQGFVGNQYTVTNKHSSNGLFGIGYFVDGLDKDKYQLSYGINGFYLGKMGVQGLLIQEHVSNNLSYTYQITNLPVYLAAKAKIKSNNEAYNILVDAGIGPNFMRTSHYNETPLNNFSMTNAFFGAENNVAFSATAGVGVRLNNVFGKVPVTCGYRFFYLGVGNMQENNVALLNSLSTGNTYANAVICGVTV